MVRRRKRIEEKDEDYQWPFEISIKIKRTKPKIAFLSGCPRDYYPDDPGFSKFSLTYCLPDPEDTVECKYYPRDDDRLNKPISRLGYGIGGLSASPRFPKGHAFDTPAPNAYQAMLVPPRKKAAKKAEKVSWRKFVEYYEQLAEERFTKKGTGERSKSKRDIRATLDLSRKVMEASSAPVSLCPSRTAVAFGRALHGARFDKITSFDTPGTGTYDPETPAKTSFQITNPQGVLIPRVRLNCIPGGCDTCLHCGIDLYLSDYYQTRQKFKVKNAPDVVDVAKYKMTYLSFCRDCYCHAVKHGYYKIWSRDKIPQLFTKARHCNMVHDHKQGQREYLSRTTCKATTSLTRKELIFSRYFKDTPCRQAI